MSPENCRQLKFDPDEWLKVYKSRFSFDEFDFFKYDLFLCTSILLDSLC